MRGTSVFISVEVIGENTEGSKEAIDRAFGEAITSLERSFEASGFIALPEAISGLIPEGMVLKMSICRDPVSSKEDDEICVPSPS